MTQPDTALRVAHQISEKTVSGSWSIEWAADQIRQAIAEETRELREALRKLRNENLAILGIARQQIRDVVGNTNFQALQVRLDEAERLLNPSTKE